MAIGRPLARLTLTDVEPGSLGDGGGADPRRQLNWWNLCASTDERVVARAAMELAEAVRYAHAQIQLRRAELVGAPCRPTAPPVP